MEKVGRYTNKASLIERRRILRKKQTEAERLLWFRIRNGQLGVKFRRQYNIGYYIVDFYCHSLKLIIEVEGWVHGEKQQEEYDQRRENYLRRQGYNILFYRNDQVINELEAVLQDIVNHIKVATSGC